MEKFIEHIGKRVISLDEARELGYILDLSFDDKLNFIGYVVIDGETENEVFLPLAKVQSAGENIIVESAASLQPLLLENNNPRFKEVVSTDGVSLGRVTDVKLVGKKIDTLITEKGELKSKHILCQSKNIIIFTKIKKNNKKNEKNSQKILNLPKIEIMNIANDATEQTFPTRVSLSPKMILNKKATQDILGLNNELIIKKDEIITQKSIEKAKKHNKINYLIFNCK